MRQPLWVELGELGSVLKEDDRRPIASEIAAKAPGGSGGGGRVLVVMCNASNPTINVAGGDSTFDGQPGTSIVRAAGILQQPINSTGCTGATTTFRVLAGGIGPITCQWTKNNTPINVLSISSAATGTLELSNVQLGDVATYRCNVTTGCGGVTSNPAALTICAADFHSDGFLDFFDSSDFVTAFEGGPGNAASTATASSTSLTTTTS